ncbi:MAG TPA: 2-hydroxyacid dehydrogenase [Limnochordales bacterium]
MRVVVASPAFPAIAQHLPRFLPEAEVVFAGPAELPVRVQEADVLIPSMARIDGALLGRAARLWLIHQWGAGLEGVDLEAATRLGIPVANVPTAGTANAASVAEWCVMAALVLARRLDEARAVARRLDAWGHPIGMSLVGRTAGVVGLGGIGTELAARLRALGMRVRAVKRHPDPGLAQRLGVEWLGSMEELPALLGASDFVFLTLPATPETRGLISRRELAAMRPGAFLVNPARGALVDEAALLEALDGGHLGGAAVDVYSVEPPAPDHPLLRHPRVLATPHIAGVTDASYADIARRVAANVRRVQAGSLPEPCANPQVAPRRPAPRQG